MIAAGQSWRLFHKSTDWLEWLAKDLIATRRTSNRQENLQNFLN